MYRVIKMFLDAQDGFHRYNEGETYPREGASALPSRIKELESKNNKLGEPLIEEVKDDVKETTEVSEKKTKKKFDE